MQANIVTYYLRKFANSVVDSTFTSPSLAEMVHHHLRADWSRQVRHPYFVYYQVYDAQNCFLEFSIADARGYADVVYERCLALLIIGVNGALVSPDDEEFASRVFGGIPFRICSYCAKPFSGWLDYYGHVKINHWETEAIS